MIRRRGRRWQWRVTRKGFPAEYGSCPTQRCAVKCAQGAEERMRSGISREKLTVAELLDLYVDAYLPTIPDSAYNYRRYVQFWKQEIGAYDVSAITPVLVGQVRAKLLERRGRRGGKLSPITVNHYVKALASAYRWGMDPKQSLVDRNPVRAIARLEEPKGRTRFLSRPVDEVASELERLLAACKSSSSPYLHDVVLLLLCTGCRASEIMELRRSEVRLANGGFTIPPERAKSEEPRFVPLEGPALEVVRRRLALPTFGSPFVFPGHERGAAAGFPKRAFATALKKAGIQDFRPHDLRHTYGSYLAMMGKTLPEIMAALGHADPKSSARYIHVADARKQEVAREAAEVMAGWLQPR